MGFGDYKSFEILVRDYKYGLSWIFMRIEKSNILVIINATLVLLGITCLYFSSLFWMGSKEDHDRLLANSYWSFFAGRLFFNILVSFFIISLIGTSSWLVGKFLRSEQKIKIWRILAIDLLIFIVSSIVFILCQ